MVVVARRAPDLPSDPAVVVTNPDDDVTAETFLAWLNHRQVGDPTSPAVRAADTLAELLPGLSSTAPRSPGVGCHRLVAVTSTPRFLSQQGIGTSSARSAGIEA